MAALEPTGKSFEIVIVDDGSTDGSVELLRELAGKDERVKVVEFMRNFGQTAAMSAGFAYARGKVYIAIDEGYDVVSGWRRKRKDKFLTRRFPSIVANKLLSAVTGVRLKDYGCSLKAYRAEYIDAVDLYGEMHRFIPAYAHMVGAKVAEIEVNHRPRTQGESKYGLSRILKVLMDLITVKFLTSYAKKPGYLFGGLGMVACLLGIASAVEVVVEKFVAGTYAHKNPFLLLAIFLFLIGVQLILMGLIAELLVRTYHESQGKPTYLIRSTINIPE